MRWPGRSEAMVRPYSWRDRPTAKSQMSIISWTSPRLSWSDLAAFQRDQLARSPLCSRSVVAQPPDQLAATRGRDLRQAWKACGRGGDLRVDLRWAVALQAGQHRTVDGAGDRQVAVRLVALEGL